MRKCGCFRKVAKVWEGLFWLRQRKDTHPPQPLLAPPDHTLAAHSHVSGPPDASTQTRVCPCVAQQEHL